MSNKIDILSAMQKYDLTLRRLSDTETSSYFIPDNPTKEEIENAHEVVILATTKEKFDKMQANGCHLNSRFHNGFIIRKVVRIKKKREGGWLVKIDSSHGAFQHWDMKDDFYGKTPEEAIEKAVKYIEEKRKSKEETYKKAGLK